jgi:hypothetical protein
MGKPIEICRPVYRISDDGPITMGATGTGAAVRKPPGKEPREVGHRWCRAHYGDFDAARVDVRGDEMARGAIVEAAQCWRGGVSRSGMRPRC